jgi:molecular chaperone GrpE
MSDNDYKPDETEAAADEQSLDAETTANDEITKLRADLAAAQDHQLRALAELDNYRKRAARELQEQQRFAQLPLMRDVLPVLDNVQRAIDAAEKTHDAATLLAGIKLVSQQLQDALKRHNCIAIPALHTPFDPHVHEAILQQPSADVPANHVLQEVLCGYKVFDRVVRPSQVIVSKGNDEGEGRKEEG